MASVESVFLGLAKEQFGLIIGIGVGEALAAALEPQAVAIKQAEYDADPNVAVDPLTSAAIVAEFVELRDWGAGEAQKHGINGERFDAIVGEVLNSPGIGQLIEMARHKKITPDDFAHGLRKLKLENRWDDALVELQTTRLSPQQLALGIVRSVVADPGLLAVTLDLSGGVVPAYPEWPGDALVEAEAGGVDKDRLRVMVGEIGLPMSAQQAASAYFRKIIKLGDYNRAILEGDTRPEWAPYILEQARQILTASEYQEAALRGVMSPDVANAKTAQHGMSPEDAATLFQILGRPLVVHQITTGLARGGTFGGTYDDVPEPYRDAIRRSNIRPEYARLAYANRYSYPSAFVLRALAEAGDLGNAAAVENILLDIGWPPFLVAKVAPRWAPKGAAVDPYVKKAQTQLWTTTHTSYKAQEIDDAAATGSFNLLGIPAAAQAEIFTLWQYERGLRRAQLSPADVRKAWQQGDINAATGTPWTQDEARAALIDRGWSVEQANDYMNIPYKG